MKSEKNDSGASASSKIRQFTPDELIYLFVSRCDGAFKIAPGLSRKGKAGWNKDAYEYRRRAVLYALARLGITGDARAWKELVERYGELIITSTRGRGRPRRDYQALRDEVSGTPRNRAKIIAKRHGLAVSTAKTYLSRRKG